METPVVPYLEILARMSIFYSPSIHLLFTFYSPSILLLFPFYSPSIPLLSSSIPVYPPSNPLLSTLYSSSISLLSLFYPPYIHPLSISYSAWSPALTMHFVSVKSTCSTQAMSGRQWELVYVSQKLICSPRFRVRSFIGIIIWRTELWCTN